MEQRIKVKVLFWNERCVFLDLDGQTADVRFDMLNGKICVAYIFALHS